MNYAFFKEFVDDMIDEIDIVKLSLFLVRKNN